MGKKKLVINAIYLSLFLILVSIASADEIVLENGDRMTGKLTKLEKEMITFETEYAEPINVQTSKIKSITTDSPVEIHLISGEVLKGRISTDESGNLSMEATDERETIVFGWEKVSAINPPPFVPPKWKGNVNVGASTQTGNSERTNITFGADATRKTEKDRYNLRFLHNYAEDDKNVTARNYYGAGKYDYFFTEDFYGYIGVELLKDKTKDLKLRTIVGPGMGYQIWDDTIKFLLFEAGISYFSEDLKKGEDKDWITARLAGDLRYNITESVIFSDQLIMYPSLENSRDFKLRNEAVVTSPLASGWSLRLANIFEHDGNPPEDVKRNDWYWILALQYSF
jgi:putative salt-induced outer membrane protein YdiY